LFVFRGQIIFAIPDKKPVKQYTEVMIQELSTTESLRIQSILYADFTLPLLKTGNFIDGLTYINLFF